MKTYTGSHAGSQIEKFLWDASASVWIVSPWIGTKYAQRLALLSQKGVEVRIVTSNVDYNYDALGTLRAAENPNLMLSVVDKEKPVLVHSKIYIVDKKHAIAGSANFTYSGMNTNIESLSIAETEDEVQKLEADFMRVWLDSERYRISKEERAPGTAYLVRKALPLNGATNYGKIDQPEIRDKELVFHPYYFFEFSFRVSAGKSPPMLFENSGLVVIDGVTRQVINDNQLIAEIASHPGEDYYLRPANKYRLTLLEPKIHDFREARELASKHIMEKNTQHYTQHYGSRSYDRIFVPYRNVISFIKSGFVQVPVWYIERHEQNGSKHQDLILGSSGKKWNELIYCPECRRKIWISQAVNCNLCGVAVCPDCIHVVGLVFKKKWCETCLSKSK
jgi:hypothetical protein